MRQYQWHLVRGMLFSMVVVAQPVLSQEAQESPDDDLIVLDKIDVWGTAEEKAKQSLGASIITAKDIEKAPPANDISEILRKQPGINLTGNSGSGGRGNNRQIDIRGMGPENTLILVDGKPVSSRNSVRYGWRGDRDSRGDTNWVPADQIERIEVLRGPSAARYGSGAAGGVVNIITKKVLDKHSGNITVYHNFPQHKDEGGTKRIDFGFSGPLTEQLMYRVYGNLNKTDRDAENINKGHTIGNAITAGREGVRNKDINGLIRWQFNPEQALEFEAGFSRQGNIYAGDSLNNSTKKADLRTPWVGRETNIMYRDNFSVTHYGNWGDVSSKSYFQVEHTRNRRLEEGLAGATEGSINGGNFTTIKLRDLTAHSEVSFPFTTGFNHMMTVGGEWNEQRMRDPASNLQSTANGGTIAGVSSEGRSEKSSTTITSAFVEDSMTFSTGTEIAPGIRYNHQTQTGSNWSPYLNVSQYLGENITLKGGIARAYKAPNLYQMNPNYLLFSKGNGCWGAGSTGCYIQGNKHLKAETSVNKEIGIEYKDAGWVASITWFHNAYHNKVEAGKTATSYATGGSGAEVFQWTNVSRAVIEGLEGNLTVPVTDTLNWNTNFTYMIETKNKETGDPLTIIPEYTINSTIDWQATDKLSLQAGTTWYGRQTPPRLDYKGRRITDRDGRREIAPYVIQSLSANYQFSKNYRGTIGINNLFDKRLYREGNSADAGAYTYNEPGRTFYMSFTASF